MSELRFRKRRKRWEYSFEGARVDGKRQTISKGGFRTKGDAAKAGAKAMNEYNSAGSAFSPSDISFADYLDLWLETYCKVNCKASTYAGYEKKNRLHIKPVLGKYRLAALTPEAIQKLLNDKFNEGYSRNSLVVIKGILTGSLSYAVQPLKYIQSNPAHYVNLPSTRATPEVKSRSAPHVYIPPEQMERVFKRFPEGSSSYLPILIGYKCGLRIGEAFGLTWDCIDLEAKKLTVQQQILWEEKNKKSGEEGYWYFTAPKYESSRTIELSQDVTDALRREKERQEKNRIRYEELFTEYYRDERGILCKEPTGECVDLVMRRECGDIIISRNMQYVDRVVQKELGIAGYNYHSLRHTHATILAEKGASPKYVQHRLGHKNIQVTMQIYQHLTEKMSEEGAKLLDTF